MMFFNKKKVKMKKFLILLKIASLLIHAAKIDEKYTNEEEEIIKKTLLELGVKKNELDNINNKCKTK